MNKTIHFISGLPRSGSTLLCNILSQNPRFFVTPTSAILDVLFNIRNQWNNLQEFKAHPNETAKVNVLRGALDGYFKNIQCPVIFDKSRGWLAHLEMAEMILDRKVKVIVPVRDVREILCSFELLWRKEAQTNQLGQERDNYVQFQTLSGRCKVWSMDSQPLGLAYNRIKDAITRGYLDRMLFVPYEQLTAHPFTTLARVYEFLGETFYAHDFANVAQITFEDDTAYGFSTNALHTIRPKVEPQPLRWPEILGEELGTVYGDSNFWEGYPNG